MGENHGQITQCCTRGNVTAVEQAGGLAGITIEFGSVGGVIVGITRDGGEITDCYSRCIVHGDDSVGGLVGRSEGKITHCYATGHVSAVNPTTSPASTNTTIGGLIGVRSTYSPVATGCYFLMNENEASGGGPNNGLGNARSDSLLKMQATFSNWAFSSPGAVWLMPENDYPRLLWEQVPVPSTKDKTLKQWTIELEASGLLLGTKEYQYHSDIPEDEVITASVARHCPAARSMSLSVKARTTGQRKLSGMARRQSLTRLLHPRRCNLLALAHSGWKSTTCWSAM